MHGTRRQVRRLYSAVQVMPVLKDGGETKTTNHGCIDQAKNYLNIKNGRGNFEQMV